MRPSELWLDVTNMYWLIHYILNCFYCKFYIVISHVLFDWKSKLLNEWMNEWMIWRVGSFISVGWLAGRVLASRGSCCAVDLRAGSSSVPGSFWCSPVCDGKTYISCTCTITQCIVTIWGRGNPCGLSAITQSGIVNISLGRFHGGVGGGSRLPQNLDGTPNFLHSFLMNRVRLCNRLHQTG